MAERFLVYSNRQDEIEEIKSIFSELPGVELVWVVESRLLGDRLAVPFIARESDDKRLRGLEGIRWFVDRVKRGEETLSAAA